MNYFTIIIYDKAFSLFVICNGAYNYYLSKM